MRGDKREHLSWTAGRWCLALPCERRIAMLLWSALYSSLLIWPSILPSPRAESRHPQRCTEITQPHPLTSLTSKLSCELSSASMLTSLTSPGKVCVDPQKHGSGSIPKRMHMHRSAPQLHTLPLKVSVRACVVAFLVRVVFVRDQLDINEETVTYTLPSLACTRAARDFVPILSYLTTSCTAYHISPVAITSTFSGQACLFVAVDWRPGPCSKQATPVTFAYTSHRLTFGCHSRARSLQQVSGRSFGCGVRIQLFCTRNGRPCATATATAAQRNATATATAMRQPSALATAAHQETKSEQTVLSIL